MRFVLGQKFIDFIRRKKKLPSDIQMIFKNIKKNIKKNKKIRVCFFVLFDSTFPAKLVYEKMLLNDKFLPFVVVIPKIKLDNLLNKSYNTLADELPNVYSSYDVQRNVFIDFSDKYDLVCSANLYDHYTLEQYKIRNITKHSLCFNIPYAYFVTSYLFDFVKIDVQKMFWRIFVENKYNKSVYISSRIPAEKVVVSGYPRLDELAEVQKERNRIRKKIIIAPHSVSLKYPKGVEFAEWLNFGDFLLTLPKKYPNIDFVFRPHPFLFAKLLEEDIWPKEKIDNYIVTMKGYPNVIYQEGGDFSFDFVNSDGIIHDCGSFLVEYLLTEHPACYMQTKKENCRFYTKLGQKCLEHCYIADTESAILKFIDEIILKENDFMQEKRVKFVESNLKFNYGNSADFIVKNILHSLYKN